jgi:hypothetical protein
MNLQELETKRAKLEYELDAVKRLIAVSKPNEFKDYYGRVCTIYPSSLATQSCIWMGVKGENTLMHLTVDHAKMIVKELDRFIMENDN